MLQHAIRWSAPAADLVRSLKFFVIREGCAGSRLIDEFSDSGGCPRPMNVIPTAEAPTDLCVFDFYLFLSEDLVICK